MDKNTKIAIGILVVGFIWHDYVILRNARAHNSLVDAVKDLYDNEERKLDAEIFQDLVERYNNE